MAGPPAVTRITSKANSARGGELGGRPRPEMAKPSSALGLAFRQCRGTSLAMIVLALALRIGVGLAQSTFTAEPNRVAGGDEPSYVGIAGSLLSGHGYSENGEIPTAYRAPGYPVFLALVFLLFGKSLVMARLVNVLISSLTVGAIYLLGVSVFGRRAGLFAGFAGAVYPYWIPLSAAVMPESLFLILVCAVLLLFQRIAERPTSWRTHLACGLTMGLATLTRPEFCLFVLLVPAWAMFFDRRFGRALGRSALLVLPVVFCVAPWVARNYVVMGDFVFSSNVGPLLWGVYNPETFGDRTLMGDWKPPRHDAHPYRTGEYPAALLQPDLRYVSEQEYNRQQTHRAVEAIRANWSLMPRMMVAKLNQLVLSAGAVENLLRLPVVYCFLLGLGLLVVSGDRRFLSLYLVLASGVAAALLFYAAPRLRMPFDMVVLLIASYGLGEQLRVLEERRGRRETAWDQRERPHG